MVFTFQLSNQTFLYHKLCGHEIQFCPFFFLRQFVYAIKLYERTKMYGHDIYFSFFKKKKKRKRKNRTHTNRHIHTPIHRLWKMLIAWKYSDVVCHKIHYGGALLKIVKGRCDFFSLSFILIPFTPHTTNKKSNQTPLKGHYIDQFVHFK